MPPMLALKHSMNILISKLARYCSRDLSSIPLLSHTKHYLTAVTASSLGIQHKNNSMKKNLTNQLDIRYLKEKILGDETVFKAALISAP